MEILRCVDIFGVKFHFYTNNHPNHQNVFGGIMTIIYLLICMGIFIVFSYEDISRLNPISSKSEISDLKPRLININNEKIWLPFRIVTDENKYIDHRGILYIFAYLVEGIFNEEKGMELNYHLLNYKFCNETSMTNKPDNYKIDVPLNELFCIDNDDIPFGGNWNGDFINYIEIDVFLCEEGVYFNLSDPRCSNINNLYNTLNSSLSFDFYYPVVQFQPTNYKTPIMTIYRNYFYRLSLFSNKLEKIYFKEHIFSDDRNILISNYKNSSCWSTSSLYGDDYVLTDEIDPLIKNKLNQIFTMEIYMDYGLIYYTRTYNTIFYIISNVFPLFRLALYFIKKFTRHIKISFTKRKLAELVFENKATPKITLFSSSNQSFNKLKVKKIDNSKNELLKEKNICSFKNIPLNEKNNSQKNITIIHFSKEQKNNDSISLKNYQGQSKRSLNDEFALKILSNKIESKRGSMLLNEPLKINESRKNNKIKKIRRHIFSFYYFFLDFIFDKIVNPQKFFCVSKAYFIVYNFMCQIYDISTHIILYKQFNLLNNALKKLYEENGVYPIHPFKKININDNDIIGKLHRGLKRKNSILFLKNI